MGNRSGTGWRSAWHAWRGGEPIYASSHFRRKWGTSPQPTRKLGLEKYRALLRTAITATAARKKYSSSKILESPELMLWRSTACWMLQTPAAACKIDDTVVVNTTFMSAVPRVQLRLNYVVHYGTGTQILPQRSCCQIIVGLDRMWLCYFTCTPRIYRLIAVNYAGINWLFNYIQLVLLII